MAGLRGGMLRTRLIGLLVLVMPMALAVCSAAAAGDTSAKPGSADRDKLDWSATSINGRKVSDISGDAPLRLSGDKPTVVALTITNDGKSPVEVTYVRITGTVMSMTFFSYSTELRSLVQPHQSIAREIRLDLYDLTGQAVGLLPARLELLDDDRKVIDGYSFSVDVQGSLASVYGVFGLAVAGITVVFLASLLLAIVRRLLPENRWKRAMRFLPVGAGLGFTLTFTLSATGLLTPSATAWLTIVLVMSASAFAVGYLLPTGSGEFDEPDEPDEPHEPHEPHSVPGTIPSQRAHDDLEADAFDEAEPDTADVERRP